MSHGENSSAPGGEVLIVEDAPSSLFLLSEILAKAGYDVRQATDGHQALWMAQKRHPDLILLDIGLPGMDGFEVCRQLRDNPATEHIPVIFLSALDDVDSKVRGLELGAVDYIGKPYQMQEVLARVQTRLTLSRRRRELEVQRQTLEVRVALRTSELERQSLEMGRILAALEMAGDGIAIVDSQNRLTYVNKAMIETFGVDHVDDLIGLRTEDLRVEGASVINAAELQVARDVVRRHGQWRGELSLSRAGSPRPGRLLVHLRELPGGGRVAVVTDVTEARRREEEQRRLERKLEQAGKLEALGQLTAGVAHDFNNLLGAILGFAQFIVEDTGDETSINRYASRILKAGQQAKALIAQLLSFSHQEAPLERVHLNTLISENLGILKAIISPSTELSFHPRADMSPLAGQASRITQLLVNLVGNASEGLNGRPGRVVIDVEAVDSDKSALIGLFRQDGGDWGDDDEVRVWTDANGIHHAILGHVSRERRYVCLSVTDTGDGIAEDVAARISEPFFTTKSMAGGTGLGLAVVHDIVVSHQAGLLLRTAPGQGTRFDIVFPLSDEDEEEAAEHPSITPISHRGSILLVDDSSHFGDMLMTALFRLGYEISVCDNPVDALGYVQEDPSAWDLVITDLAMPQMSGRTLVAAVKQIRKDLPCIICTAFPNGLSEDDALAAGADGLAIKPLDLGKFSVKVKEVISRISE